MELGEIEGAMSSLSIAVAGLLTRTGSVGVCGTVVIDEDADNPVHCDRTEISIHGVSSVRSNKCRLDAYFREI